MSSTLGASRGSKVIDRLNEPICDMDRDRGLFTVAANLGCGEANNSTTTVVVEPLKT